MFFGMAPKAFRQRMAHRALVARHWEQSRARKDMVLEGNHSRRGLVAEITKTVADAICQSQRMLLGWFRV